MFQHEAAFPHDPPHRPDVFVNRQPSINTYSYLNASAGSTRVAIRLGYHAQARVRR